MGRAFYAGRVTIFMFNPFAVRFRSSKRDTNEKGTTMKTLLTVVAAATLLASAPAFAHGGLVDLSVYDRTEGRRLQVYWHEGRAWIAGRPGNEYQVTLRSRQSQDTLAIVSVDGINVITGQSADPSQS